MATVQQENPLNNDVDHLIQKIENLQIALKASSDAYQSALVQSKKDRSKYQTEVDRICAAANLKEFQLQENIKHFEDQLISQPSPSKTQVTHQPQQTLHENLHVDQEQQTLPTDLLANPQPVKDIVTVFTQTDLQEPRTPQLVKIIDTVTQADEDEVVLSNLNKIFKLERELSQMDHNQDLLLSELHLQKRDNNALQEEITMLTKKMAEVIYANNLYHVSLLEQNCSLPPQLSPHQMSPPTTPTVSTAKEGQDTKSLKKDHHIATLFPLKEEATLFPLKEDPIQPPKQEASKTVNKELAWIIKMSKALAKLEKKFAIPLEKRKQWMFKRKIKTNHIIPKPFRTMFHLLAAPSSDPITVQEPYPVVDWSNVRFKPALPSPQDLPLLSASKDPE
jgi:hypothetical protein